MELSKTLDRQELNFDKKVRILEHFTLTMVAKKYCLEYIAECLTLVVPALNPECLPQPSLSSKPPEKLLKIIKGK